MAYALLLSGFIYLLFIFGRAVNYIRFANLLKNVKAGAHGDDFNISGLSCQQRETLVTLQNITRKGLNREHQLQLQNDEKQRVISQIVHNIKTPAAVIDLAVQNYKAGEDDITKTLEQIITENRMITENLDQVLSYLRLDQFHHDYLIEPVDLASQLREKINQKKESFIHNNVFPRMSVDAEAKLVLTDKKWNGVILDQIISNAIKYTAIKDEEGSIHFTIKTLEDKVTLEIEDNGIGIPEFDLRRIFEPFYTGENGRRVKSASGIGLYICQKIAHELNYQIEVTSEAGRGTKVVISYLTKM